MDIQPTWKVHSDRGYSNMLRLKSGLWLVISSSRLVARLRKHLSIWQEYKDWSTVNIRSRVAVGRRFSWLQKLRTYSLKKKRKEKVPCCKSYMHHASKRILILGLKRLRYWRRRSFVRVLLEALVFLSQSLKKRFFRCVQNLHWSAVFHTLCITGRTRNISRIIHSVYRLDQWPHFCITNSGDLWDIFFVTWFQLLFIEKNISSDFFKNNLLDISGDCIWIPCDIMWGLRPLGWKTPA